MTDGVIHSVAYSHQDFGYAANPYRLRTEVRLENLFRSVNYCEVTEWNGNGFIVRLVETTGHKTSARLAFPFLDHIASANETTLTEDDLERPLRVDNDSVTVEISPYGIKTIRVLGAAAPCVKVAHVKAKALSDMEVRLEWAPVDDAAYYRVYRSESPDFEPSQLTLVAIPAEAKFVDKARNHFSGWVANRLHPATTYHYRVEAVSRQNRRGPASDSVAVTTLTTEQKACPPGPVQDLHAVAVSSLAPINEINLLWRSNVEPNIGGNLLSLRPC